MIGKTERVYLHGGLHHGETVLAAVGIGSIEFPVRLESVRHPDGFVGVGLVTAIYERTEAVHYGLPVYFCRDPKRGRPAGGLDPTEVEA